MASIDLVDWLCIGAAVVLAGALGFGAVRLVQSDARERRDRESRMRHLEMSQAKIRAEMDAAARKREEPHR